MHIPSHAGAEARGEPTRRVCLVGREGDEVMVRANVGLTTREATRRVEDVEL